MTEVEASLKNLRVSPRKVRLVVKVLKDKKASEALDYLRFIYKKSSLPLSKLIKSAVANAKNNFNLDEKNLKIKDLIVEEGPTLKRFRAQPRGSAPPIKKRTCHIKEVLGG